MAEISRYAAERSQQRGIAASAVSAGIWRSDFRTPLPKTNSHPLRALSVGPPSGVATYEKFLADQIASAGNVRTTGLVDTATRTVLVAEADVLLANSSHVTYTGFVFDQVELLGLDILEAVAVGTLPIVSDIPSFREIMEELSLAALLARVRDLQPDALRDRVSAAREGVMRSFLWDTYWQRLMEAALLHPTAGRITVA